MHWLPIPIPVDDYKYLAVKHWRSAKTLRVAHSPTNPRIKGTLALECAIQDLRIKGLPIELVKIEGKSHAEALILKASCDVTFDSFWLGIQGSGLEAAAMGHAVIAGDPEVKAEYESSVVGHCPYTYAREFDELKLVLARLVEDWDYRAAEARRVSEYVRKWHDYPSVGELYWQIIREARTDRGWPS